MVFSYLVQKAGKGQNGIWGDQIVIDWKEEAEKTYGFQVNTLRRGRGSWILETDQGLRLLKEYRGSVNRLEFEEAVLQSLDGMETVKADQYGWLRCGGLWGSLSLLVSRPAHRRCKAVCEKLRGRTFIFGGGWKPVYCETMVCGPGM